MKVVKGRFEGKDTDKNTTKDKILKAVEQMPYLDTTDQYDFSLVVSDPEGYTTVATNVCIADTVFMLESSKLGLILNMSGHDDDDILH
jgi:hypothetical protein